MNAAVVYDSVFGNTEVIARAIGDGLGGSGEVGLYRVGEVTWERVSGIELLVVGSPTRAFRPTEAITKFVRSIPDQGLRGVRVLAFDTRVAAEDVDSRFLGAMVRWFGYAAPHIDKSLKQKGGSATAPPEGFFVTGKEGPLREGEEERARAWVVDACQ